MTKKSNLEIIVPVYNESYGLYENIMTISSYLSPKVNNIITLIDDGSTDSTRREIEALSAGNGYIKGIYLAKHAGKEHAIYTGLENSSADACMVMDCDLQHPPRLIPVFVDKWLEGYMVVEGIKTSRGKESYFNKTMASAFSKIIKRFFNINLYNSTDYKLIDRSVTDKLLSDDNSCKFFRGAVSSLNLKSCPIYFDVEPRAYGSSKFGLHSKIKLASDAFKTLSKKNNTEFNKMH